MTISRSLTIRANGGLLNVIKSECHVSQGFNPVDGILDCPNITFNAIWDTGATGSVITPRVVQLCDLKPVSVCQVQGVHGIQASNVYLVNIALPNHVVFTEVSVTEGNLPPGDDLLIGMDIIATGDFSITNKDGLTVFSFRYPSQHHIDYVEEHNNNLLKAKHVHGGTKKPKNKLGKQFGKNKNRKK